MGGFHVHIGLLPELAREDREAFLVVKLQFENIAAHFRTWGLPAHTEPTRLSRRRPRRVAPDSVPFEWFHALRRVEAYRLLGKELTPLTEEPSGRVDPVVEEVASPSSHLLCHADSEGYYLPLDFPNVQIHDSLPGQAVGSSVRLLTELSAVAPLIGVTQLPASSGQLRLIGATHQGSHPYWRERQAWAHVFEGATWSVTLQSVLSFGIPNEGYA